MKALEKVLLFQKADMYKEAISKARPLSEQEVKNLQEYFKVGLTFSSNALEGNTLDITETKIILEDGITVEGKPIRDYYEAVGHAKAYDFMLNAAKIRPFELTEELINRLHYLFYHAIDVDNAGGYRKVQNFITGTEYVPPSPAKIPDLMHSFVERMNEAKWKLHPIEYAALLHKGLVDIHPYVDGNGRTARLLMNLALVNEGYGVTIIPPVLRREYISTISISQVKDHRNTDPFVCFIAERVIETQKDYCRMLEISLPKETVSIINMADIKFDEK